MQCEIKDYKVNELPPKGKPNSRYYVPNGNGTDIDEYVTDKDGEYHKVCCGGGDGGVIEEEDPIALAKEITLNQGSGISILGTAGQTLESDPSWTISHGDTSSVSNLDTTGAQVIDTLTFDTFGHVQTVTTRNLTLSDLGYVAPTDTNWANTNLTLTGNRTHNLGTNTMQVNYAGPSYQYNQGSTTSPGIETYMEGTNFTAYNQVFGGVTSATWSEYTSGGGGNQYILNTSSNAKQDFQIGSYRDVAGTWVDFKLQACNDGTNAGSYWFTHRELWAGAGPFTNTAINMDDEGISLLTSTGVVAAPNYKGILVDSSSNIRFHNYPNTRDDGVAEKVLFIDNVNGDIKLGTLPSTGGAIIDGIYRFDTSTVAADPGSGDVRFNNAAYASVTQIYISQLSEPGTDVGNILGTLKAGDVIYLQDRNDATKWFRADINATPTDNGAWWTIPVTYVNSGGTLFGNNQELNVIALLNSGSGIDTHLGNTNLTWTANRTHNMAGFGNTFNNSGNWAFNLPANNNTNFDVFGARGVFFEIMGTDGTSPYYGYYDLWPTFNEFYIQRDDGEVTISMNPTDTLSELNMAVEVNGNGSYITMFDTNIDLQPYFGDLRIQSLTNLASQDRLLGQASGTNNQVGYVTIGSGLSLVSGVLSASSSSVTWDAIGSPVADQALTFQAGESSTWTDQNTTEDLFTVNNATQTTGSMFSLNRTSTVTSTGNNIMELVSSGTNAGDSTAIGLNISVTNTHATLGTNKALVLTASGAPVRNVALETTAGRVGINTPVPQTLLQVGHNGSSSAFGTAAQLLVTNQGSGSFMSILGPSGKEMFIGADTPGGIVGTISNDDLLFRTNNTLRATITTAGVLKLESVVQDDTEDKLLVWNSTDKEVQYRDVSTVSGGGYTDEEAQDALAAAFAAGTHTGITITYNDGTDSFDFAATSSSTPESPDKKRGDVLGPIFSQSSFANTTGFTVTGAAPTFSGGRMLVTGGTTSIIALDYYTMLERWTIKHRFRVDEKSGTSYGTGVAVISSNTSYQQNIVGLIQLRSTPSAYEGTLILNDGAAFNNNLATSVAAVSFVVTDVIEVELKRDVNVFTFIARNVTTGGDEVSISYTYTGLTTAVNTGTPAMFYSGGDVATEHFEFYSDESKGAEIMTVGDSKNTWYGNAINERIPNLMYERYGTVINHSGSGDKTAEVLATIDEIIALEPKVVLLSIGSNDIRTGVSEATREANIDDIYDQLTAAGIKVRFGLMYETDADQSTLISHLNTNYPNEYIDEGYESGLNAGNVLLVDNIHMNAYGNKKWVEAVFQSGKLPINQAFNESDSTSHTLRFSTLEGSLTIAEGTNVTLSTSGTEKDGIVTIAASGVSEPDNQVVVGTGAGVDSYSTFLFNDSTNKLRVNGQIGVNVDPTSSIHIKDADTGVTSFLIEDVGSSQYRLKIREYGGIFEGYNSVMQMYNAYSAGILNLGAGNEGDLLKLAIGSGVNAVIRHAAGNLTDVVLELKGRASQTGDFLNISTSSGTADLIKVEANGNTTIFGTLSVPHGTSSERFGVSASASGTSATAVGKLSSANFNESTAIGYNAVASSTNTVALGSNSLASGTNSLAIGRQCLASASGAISLGLNTTASGSGSTALGSQAEAAAQYATAIGEFARVKTFGSVGIGRGTFIDTGHTYSIAIGSGAFTTAANQMVIGEGLYGSIQQVYIGTGVVYSGPSAVTLNATGATGADVAGVDFNIAAGKATGNAVGGKITFKTSDAGVSGTTLQSLTNKFEILNTGQLRANGYGSGTFTGTDVKWLAVTSTGLIIEENPPSGGPGGGGYTVYEIDDTDSPYTISETSGEIVILVDASAGAVTVNLPTAVGNTAKYNIKLVADGNTLDIIPDGAETIDGSASVPITVENVAVTIINNNANWFII